MNAPVDPLADFRPDGYGLDAERRTRMRSRVLGAIPDDPASTVPWAGDPDLVDLQLLETHPMPSRRPSPRHRRSPNGRRLLAAAVVAVAIGLLAVVVGTSRSSDRQIGTLDESSPEVTLDDLAALAGAQPARPLLPGEYQYVETEQTGPDDAGEGHIDIIVDLNWHTIDGSGFRRSWVYPRPTGAPPGTALDRTDVPLVVDDPGQPWFGPFSYLGLSNAPTEPEALIEAVAAAMAANGEATPTTLETAAEIAKLESLTITPPAVRSAGLRALIILGFEPVGVVTDPLGRTGLGFQAADADGVQVIALDASTGRTLGVWSGSLTDATLTPELASRWIAYAHDGVKSPPA